MIKFSEFAGALYKGMGTKEQEGKFAQELFYNIVDCYSDENPLDSTTVDAFYRYFNNLRGISAVSRKIKQYTDPIKIFGISHGRVQRRHGTGYMHES